MDLSTAVIDSWKRAFQDAEGQELYRRIRAYRLPESDWVYYSQQKVTDFIKTLVAAHRILDTGQPFSTLETGVFAGGTSALLLALLGETYGPRSVHAGVDPYFTLEQAYPEYAEDYGYATYYQTMKELSGIASLLNVPYVPYVMGSDTFIKKDLLMQGYDFRLFHLDGDHSYEAVMGELTYFSSKVRHSAVFILDDLGETFPDVQRAADRFGKDHPGFIELQRFLYPLENGAIGFGVYHYTADR
jgi:hypothetical protein